MATASEELKRALSGEGPLGKAHPDEPVFVLRANDSLSVDAMEKWIIVATGMGVKNSKVQEVKNIIEEFRNWHTRKLPD